MAEIHAVSPGGSGFQFLLRKFRFQMAAHHRSHSMGSTIATEVAGPLGKPMAPGDRFVYVFANPYDVLLSYNHRPGFLDVSPPTIIVQIEGDAMSFTYGGLERYLAESPRDMFRLGHHYNMFYCAPHRGLFVKYDFLASSFDEISKFTGLSPATDEGLKQRYSDWASAPETVKSGLRRLHGKWFDFYSSLPGVFTNDPKSIDRFWWHLEDTGAR